MLWQIDFNGCSIDEAGIPTHSLFQIDFDSIPCLSFVHQYLNHSLHIVESQNAPAVGSRPMAFTLAILVPHIPRETGSLSMHDVSLDLSTIKEILQKRL